MDAALAEARAAATHGEVPVGAVVAAADGAMVSRAGNERERRQDPTAHAEVRALRDAASARGSWRLAGYVLVVTLEPCPMCAGAAVAAHLDAGRVRRGRPEGRRAGEPLQPRRGPGSTTSSRSSTACARRSAVPCSPSSSPPAAPDAAARGRHARRWSPIPITAGSDGLGPGPGALARSTRRIVDGGMPERPNGAVSKTVVSSNGHRGFKSHSLRQDVMSRDIEDACRGSSWTIGGGAGSRGWDRG